MWREASTQAQTHNRAHAQIQLHRGNRQVAVAQSQLKPQGRQMMDKLTAQEIFDLADIAWAHGSEHFEDEAVWSKYLALSYKLNELAFSMKATA